MKIKKKVVSLLTSLMVVLSLVGCGSNIDSVNNAANNEASISENQKNTLNNSEVTDTVNEVSRDDTTAPFEVRMLDVGQGLSILVKCDDHYMIYDGGGRKYSSYVVSYLQNHGIDKLDYMFVSHYDEDHINGLVGVLNTTSVGETITPDYAADSKVYESFRNMLAKNGSTEIHPSIGETFTLGDASIQVLNVKSDSYTDENDYSTVIKITYKNFKTIITGDAEWESESDMIASGVDLKTDLYVVGHHGSASSSSDSFVSAMSPQYAFISVGKGNSYGHPAEKTLATLNKYNCKIYRTDEQGEVTAYSDGESIWFNTNPIVDDVNNATVSDDSDASNSYTGEYVLNTKSKKIHLPTCSSLDQMSEQNKETTTKSKEELLNEGYTLCGNCNP